MEKIAIIGLGCVFPGASSPEKLWQVLEDGLDMTSPLSEQELTADPAFYYHPEKGTIDKIGYSKNGHVRDFSFDNSGFAIAKQELDQLDSMLSEMMAS